MATPAASSAAHRRNLLALTAMSGRDLRLLFKQFKTAEQTRDGLAETLPRLMTLYGSAAATLGADWYDELRHRANAKGSFRAIPAELPDHERTNALARWATEPLFAEQPDFTTALSKVSGGLQRIVANADRQTVLGSIRSDPRAYGWQRVTSAGCDFCVMLAGRGAVYSAETADFDSHDHCHCFAEAVFDSGAEVQESTDWRPAASRKNIPDQVDVDAARSVDQLSETLASLERSLAKFDSPGTRARVEELRREISGR